MADFASAGATQRRHLSDGKRREVVVHHETFLRLAFQPVESLDIFGCTKGCRHQRLRLASGEYGGAMSARQYAGFDPDGTDLVEFTPVGTLAFKQDFITENSFLERIEEPLDHLQFFGIRLRVRKERDGLCFRG